MPRIYGVRERRRQQFWDSYIPGDEPREMLFRNRNIGQVTLCNLMIAGMFGGDNTFVVHHWYARTDAPRWENSPLARLSHVSTTKMVVGSGTTWQSSLFDLLRTKPISTPEEMTLYQKRLDDGWDPQVIPVRQNFGVNVEAPNREVEAFQMEWNGPRPRVWVHVEGIEIRDVM